MDIEYSTIHDIGYFTAMTYHFGPFLHTFQLWCFFLKCPRYSPFTHPYRHTVHVGNNEFCEEYANLTYHKLSKAMVS